MPIVYGFGCFDVCDGFYGSPRTPFLSIIRFFGFFTHFVVGYKFHFYSLFLVLISLVTIDGNIAVIRFCKCVNRTAYGSTVFRRYVSSAVSMVSDILSCLKPVTAAVSIHVPSFFFTIAFFPIMGVKAI